MEATASGSSSFCLPNRRAFENDMLKYYPYHERIQFYKNKFRNNYSIPSCVDILPVAPLITDLLKSQRNLKIKFVSADPKRVFMTFSSIDATNLEVQVSCDDIAPSTVFLHGQLINWEGVCFAIGTEDIPSVQRALGAYGFDLEPLWNFGFIFSPEIIQLMASVGFNVGRGELKHAISMQNVAMVKYLIETRNIIPTNNHFNQINMNTPAFREIEGIMRTNFVKHFSIQEALSNNFCKLPSGPTTFGGDCSICFDLFNGRAKTLTLPCSHTFHMSCIKKWLRTNATCALCRAPVPN